MRSNRERLTTRASPRKRTRSRKGRSIGNRGIFGEKSTGGWGKKRLGWVSDGSVVEGWFGLVVEGWFGLVIGGWFGLVVGGWFGGDWVSGDWVSDDRLGDSVGDSVSGWFGD